MDRTTRGKLAAILLDHRWPELIGGFVGRRILWVTERINLKSILCLQQKSRRLTGWVRSTCSAAPTRSWGATRTPPRCLLRCGRGMAVRSRTRVGTCSRMTGAPWPSRMSRSRIRAPTPVEPPTTRAGTRPLARPSCWVSLEAELAWFTHAIFDAISRTKCALPYPTRMLFSRSIACIGKKVITYYLKTPFFPISAN